MYEDLQTFMVRYCVHACSVSTQKAEAGPLQAQAQLQCTASSKPTRATRRDSVSRNIRGKSPSRKKVTVHIWKDSSPQKMLILIHV